MLNIPILAGECCWQYISHYMLELSEFFLSFILGFFFEAGFLCLIALVALELSL